MLPVTLSITVFAHSGGVVLAVSLLVLMVVMACSAFCAVVGPMCREELSVLVCRAVRPGGAWVAMMCDECLVGVVTFACLVLRLRVLCVCGVVEFGWRVLLGANLVVVIFVCVLLLLLSSVVGLHWLLRGRMYVEVVARPLRLGPMLLWRMLTGRCVVVPPSEVVQGLQPPSEVLLCVLVLYFGI
jgi:hypothetical protein